MAIRAPVREVVDFFVTSSVSGRAAYVLFRPNASHTSVVGWEDLASLMRFVRCASQIETQRVRTRQDIRAIVTLYQLSPDTEEKLCSALDIK